MSLSLRQTIQMLIQNAKLRGNISILYDVSPNHCNHAVTQKQTSPQPYENKQQAIGESLKLVGVMKG
jgi:ABC-type phosphate/phosphonate transport system ATPase subunit